MISVKEIIEQENELFLKNNKNINIVELNEITETILNSCDEEDLVKDFRSTYRKNLKDYFSKSENDTNYVSTDSLKDYLKSIYGYPTLSKEEEIELAIKIENGDLNAKKILIECNLKFVVFIAKMNPLFKTYPMDIIQAGNIGLMEAINKFDYRKNFKLSTYASWWIKREIHKYSSEIKGNIIFSSQDYTNYITIKNTIEELTLSLHREPSINEIANKTGINYQKIIGLLQCIQGTTSLNTPVNDEDKETELLELIPSDIDSIDKSFEKEEQRKIVRAFIDNSKLSDTQKEIIRRRFGIGYQHMQREIDIAKELQLSSSRVSQQEKNALHKLKISAKSIKEDLI